MFEQIASPRRVVQLNGLPIAAPRHATYSLIVNVSSTPSPSTVGALMYHLVATCDFHTDRYLRVVGRRQRRGRTNHTQVFFRSLRQRSRPTLKRYTWPTTALPNSLAIYVGHDNCHTLLVFGHVTRAQTLLSVVVPRRHHRSR